MAMHGNLTLDGIINLPGTPVALIFHVILQAAIPMATYPFQNLATWSFGESTSMIPVPAMAT